MRQAKKKNRRPRTRPASAGTHGKPEVAQEATWEEAESGTETEVTEDEQIILPTGIDDQVDDVCEVFDSDIIPAGTPLSSLHPTARKVMEDLHARLGLRHAVGVIDGTITHPQQFVSLYEAGVMLCAATFFDYAPTIRAEGAFLQHFTPTTAVELVIFWKKLIRATRRCFEAGHAVPRTLSLDILPQDAPGFWNETPERIANAVELIVGRMSIAAPKTWHVTMMSYIFVLFTQFPSSWEGRVRITQMKTASMTLVLKCGICFEGAKKDEKCSTCRYVICKGCRTDMKKMECPFCRAAW